MRKRKVRAVILLLITTMLLTASGCAFGGAEKETEEERVLTPDDYSPSYYTSEEAVPDGSYCIVHEDEDNTYYYPLLSVEKTYSSTNSSMKGSDTSRLWWVNYSVNEGLIPTMYKGDILIYKSSAGVSMTYVFEKFYDEGYTIGICGLQKDVSGHYEYYGGSGSYVLSTSDAAWIGDLSASNIFLAYVDGEKVTSSMLSSSGTLYNLECMGTYLCDIRVGTKSIERELTACAHYFTSAETYLGYDFEFVTPYLAEIYMPDWCVTGYYDLNGAGIFRYVSDGSSYSSLGQSDYNETVYVYNSDNEIVGTTNGYVVDDSGYLVEGEVDSEDLGYTYEPDYSYLDDTENVEDSVEDSEKVTEMETGTEEISTDGYLLTLEEEDITENTEESE